MLWRGAELLNDQLHYNKKFHINAVDEGYWLPNNAARFPSASVKVDIKFSTLNNEQCRYRR